MVMKHSNNVRGASFAALAAALSFVLIYLGQALALFDIRINFFMKNTISIWFIL